MKAFQDSPAPIEILHLLFFPFLSCSFSSKLMNPSSSLRSLLGSSLAPCWLFKTSSFFFFFYIKKIVMTTTIPMQVKFSLARSFLRHSAYFMHHSFNFIFINDAKYFKPHHPHPTNQLLCSDQIDLSPQRTLWHVTAGRRSTSVNNQVNNSSCAAVSQERACWWIWGGGRW